jgi:hypothetical protein
LETVYLATTHGMSNTSVRVCAITPNGDVYSRSIPSGHQWQVSDPPDYHGNFWWSSPVPTSSESWGSIKSRGK